MSSWPPKTLTPTAATERTGRGHHREDQVDVVDHQVEDDADVGGAEGVDPQPLRGDVLGPKGRPSSAVSAGLNRSMWPTWQRRTSPFREGDQFLGLDQRRGQRLLDHRRDPALEERSGDLAMEPSRDGDRDGIDLIEQEAVVG